MYIFKNSLRNLWINKGRNILLAVVIFIVILSAVVALAINNTALSIIDDYKDRFSTEVVISLDYRSLQDSGTNIGEIEAITPEQYIDFGDSEYLSYASFSATSSCNAVEFEPIDSDVSSELQNPGFPGGGGGMMNLSSNVKLLGGYYDEFDSGERGLLDSDKYPNSQYPGQNECIISESLAELNGLKIGDSIKLEVDVSESNDGSVMYCYTLKIVGVYYDYTEEYSSRLEHPYLNRRNEVLTSFDTVVQIFEQHTLVNRNITINATYYLSDPDTLEMFEAELREKGLATVYSVSTDTATYDQIVKPVVSLKNISLIFLIVIMIIGAVVISVVTSIAIRERKYEIGTLRAIGMKKSKVALGLVAETFLITVICLVIGLGIGIAVSQPISDFLLEKQVEASTVPNFGGNMGERPTEGMRFDGGFIQQARPGTTNLSEMDLSFSVWTILEIIMIGLLLALIPATLIVRKITKYEPIKIISERN